MKLAIQLFLLALALWWAHVAGAAYLRSKDDPAIRYAAIARTIMAVIVAGLVVII